MSSDDAVRAGIASLMRKAATPARTSRMKMPEPLAAPEKMRSPGCRTARCVVGGSVGAFVAVTVAPWTRGRLRAVRRPGASDGAPGRRDELGSARGDRVDGRLTLV